jgi:hypothetical protein
MPASPQDSTCPGCHRELSDPAGQELTQLGQPTFLPSKVCDTCKTGYFLGASGWVAVATF